MSLGGNFGVGAMEITRKTIPNAIMKTGAVELKETRKQKKAREEAEKQAREEAEKQAKETEVAKTEAENKSKPLGELINL